MQNSSEQTTVGDIEIIYALRVSLQSISYYLFPTTSFKSHLLSLCAYIYLRTLTVSVQGLDDSRETGSA